MVTAMPGGRRRLDRVMEPSFLADLSDLPMDEVRARRQEAMREEADLSYVRRMLQGRIEIVEQEVDLDGSESDAELVAKLTQALMPHTTSPGASSRHLVAEPDRLAERRRYVERLIADVGLSDPSSLTPETARRALDKLREQERIVSQTRGAVHGIIDTLTAELGRRYRTGSLG